MDIKANDQVTVRKKLISGANLIKTGKVVSVRGENALVQFQGEPVNRSVPLKQLEPVSKRFAGRSSVHPNPVLRMNRG